MTYVALVTGASAGIGEATARRLAAEPDVELVLVARREDRLRALASELGGATVIAEDLTAAGAPQRIADAVRAERGSLHLLVNNAGAAWRDSFADGGWESIARHLALDFEAPVRLTEALLPLLRETAGRDDAPSRRVAVVNVSSATVWAGRPNTGGYAAAKAALLAWSESLRAEEARHRVHVGVVVPGFVATEGFPAAELISSPLTRRLVSRPEVTAEAVLEAGPGGRAQRFTPRAYGLLPLLKALVPGLVRRSVARGAYTTASRPRA